jgi:hypothetical protein
LTHQLSTTTSYALLSTLLLFMHALQMILDKKFAGTLDQGAGCLEVFAEPPAAGMYGDALDIMDTLGSVVDTLWTRSQNVVAAV